MPFSKLSPGVAAWLTILLLVISFFLGVLLWMTVVDRNATQKRLDEKRQEVKDIREDKKGIEDLKDQVERSLNTCQASLGKQNQALADAQRTAIKDDQQAEGQAQAKMKELPTLIARDRTLEAKPAAATSWLKSLYQ